jgi:hypothetical protein
MPRVLPALVLAFALPARGAEKIPWTGDRAAAFAQAGETRGPLLILFTGPECGIKSAAGDPVSGGGSMLPAQDFQDRCELLEADVLSSPDVVAAAARFVPVQSSEGLLRRARISEADDTLNRRYHVVNIPTVLFADPWGNEIMRLVGRIPKDAVLRILKAIPSDFTPLEAAGRRLKEDAGNAEALVAHATFYQQRGLLAVSERFYELALGTSALTTDVAKRRQVVIARGMNLIFMDKTSEAAKLFETTLSEAPDGPASDALCFGWMMAEIHGKRLKEARRVYAELEKRFPTSPFTAKAKQNLEASGGPNR